MFNHVDVTDQICYGHGGAFGARLGGSLGFVSREHRRSPRLGARWSAISVLLATVEVPPRTPSRGRFDAGAAR